VIRVLSYPDRHRNPYFRLFYEALKPYGVEVTYTDDIADRLFSASEVEFDVLHLHRNIHHLWRRPNGHFGQATAIVEWWNFLRLTRRAGIRIVWTTHEILPREQKRWFDLLGYTVCRNAAALAPREKSAYPSATPAASLPPARRSEAGGLDVMVEFCCFRRELPLEIRNPLRCAALSAARLMHCRAET
jgi:hypothetical protein